MLKLLYPEMKYNFIQTSLFTPNNKSNSCENRTEKSIFINVYSIPYNLLYCKIIYSTLAAHTTRRFILNSKFHVSSTVVPLTVTTVIAGDVGVPKPRPSPPVPELSRQRVRPGQRYLNKHLFTKRMHLQSERSAV